MVERSQRVKQELLSRIRDADRMLGSASSAAERMELATHRFSYSKMLATVFEDCAELPRSHSLLSEAYFEAGCVSQSLAHSMIAVRCRALGLPERQRIELTLAKCCLLVDSHEEAMDRLQGLDRQLPAEGASAMEVQQLMVRCLCRKQDYAAALAKQDQYLEGCGRHHGRLSVAFALGLVERGGILASSGQYREAEEHQQAAIDTLIAISYDEVRVVSDLYVRLASYQKHNGNLEAEYSSLVKARNIYNERAEHIHQLIEVRHSLEKNLQARGSLAECLRECLEIRDMERTLYGEITPQVGRTERRIADVYLLLEKRAQGTHPPNPAIQHYLKAISILEENGEKKQVLELDGVVRGLRDMKPARRILKSAMNRL